MSVSVQVAITHYPTPEREAWLAEHLTLLSGLLVTVATDDVGYRLDNYRRGWAVAETASTTHLAVLSDDMRPCPGFREKLLGAIEARPTAVICLFSMRQCITEARALGRSWVQTPNCAWGGAMVMPCSWWQTFARWEREHVIDDADHQSDDTRIALWVRETMQSIWLTAPTLLEHVGAGSSLIGHSNSRRVSPWLATDEPIDWSTPALRASRCARGDTAWLR